ncbi:MAG: cytidine deaminase [Planctomycetota bacterium]
MSDPEHADPTMVDPTRVAAIRARLERREQLDVASLEPLARAAGAVAERAHAPYSKLRVGAAVVDRAGRVVVGCNVENASYGLTVCAERTALASARAVGLGPIDLVVLTSSAGAIPPCGACRQVLLELAPEAWVVAFGGGSVRAWSVRDLLPSAFEGLSY